ncbi:MAG TPA: acyl carrier protein [bacterium]|nr:acyl carrier protein [bacterium]HPJ72896.1 acyl carrier protein [bacterium]
MDNQAVLRRIFRELLHVSEKDFGDNLSPSSVPAWDSISHLALYHALEQEFGVTFSIGEILSMDSVSAIKCFLRNKGVEFPEAPE